MIDEPRREFVALDLETTGLSPQVDRIVEIGAVRFDSSGQELSRFERLVNPRRPMPLAAQRIHGISDAELAGAPGIETVLPEFLSWLGEPAAASLVAHNARFDASFLGCELARLGADESGREVFDTLALARRQLPQYRTHRLDFLAEVLRLDLGGPHRALADSLRVKALWLALRGAVSPPLAYRIVPVASAPGLPVGWERLTEAIALGHRVRLEYTGGSRGTSPRDITPRRLVQRGGTSYLVALCHVDRFEKEFRLDRVIRFEVFAGPDARQDPCPPSS
jgi:DNA polymerase III epsilon subunit family exonuclease